MNKKIQEPIVEPHICDCGCGKNSSICISCMKGRCTNMMTLYVCNICINEYHNNPNEFTEQKKKFIKLQIDLNNYMTKIKSLTNILEISIYDKKIDIIATILDNESEEIHEKACYLIR